MADIFNSVSPLDQSVPVGGVSPYDLFAATPQGQADLMGVPVSAMNAPVPVTAFQRGYVNYADAPQPGLVPAFIQSADLMTLDPDAFGTKTAGWAKMNGLNYGSDYVAGLTVFGRAMSREQLEKSDAGRELLELATRNRQGKKRGFWESLFDFHWSDLPFVGTLATVAGSATDAVTVYDTMKKLQNGEAVSDEDLIKTRLYMAKQEYDSNGSWGATVADIIRQAPGFMAEFFLSGGMFSVVRGALSKASSGGIHLALTRGAKILAREAVEDQATRVAAEVAGKTGAQIAAKNFADLVGTKAEKKIIKEVTDQLFGYMRSKETGAMYKGFSDQALREMAKNRAQYEFGKLISRKGGSALSNGFHSFAQWTGRHISSGLLDFGAYGSEEATVLFTRSSTAGRALADAVGVFALDAPIKGALLMLPKKGVEQALIAPVFGQDGRLASNSQLAMRSSALVSGNQSLMDNAEAVSFGMDLLEYISENTGRGFGSLLSAAGIGLERAGVRGLVRPLTSAISPAGVLLPTKGAEAFTVGGRMRQFVQKIFGSRADYARRIAGQESDLVIRRLGVSGADASAVRQAVLSGNLMTLRPELQQAIGPDLRKFVADTVRQAYDQAERDLQFKSYARYATAKWLQKHNVGPETVLNMYDRMGYDGVLGEIFEERYSDVVKGLLGLNDQAGSVHILGESSEEASFFNNLKEAVKGLYPGFSQLMAEAVGFMVPMVTRGLVMRAMSAVGGGGELTELRSQLDVLDDALRHNPVGEMTYSDAQAAFAYAQQQDDNEVKQLRTRLATARQAGAADDVKAIEREIETRTEVAQRRAERQRIYFDSVDDAAKNTADALIAVPLDTYGELSSQSANRAPVLTESQARQVLDAQRALGDFASQFARRLVEGQLPIEGESEGAFRKVARRLIGAAGAFVTGDFSLMAENPAQWIARDMGLAKPVIDALREGFRKELTGVRQQMPDAASTKEVLDEAQRRFDKRARQIMMSNLAVHQLRTFSDGTLREQAAAQWATQNVDTDGRKWEYAVDAEGRGTFFKLAEDGTTVDKATTKSIAEMWAEHGDAIEKVKQDILKATVDIITRRWTATEVDRNTVLAAVNLDSRSDMLDIALYDAAMHMIGAQDTIYRVSLDGRTPLKAVMDTRSVGRVSDGVVDLIASKQRAEDVDSLAYESIAQSLKLKFDGTEAGLKERNDKIYRMAKLMRLNRREGWVFFSKEILEEDSDAARMSANGTSTLVAKQQTDGTYTVDYGVKKDNPKQRDIRSYSGIEELRQAMEAEGYIQDTAHTVLTQAKVIESSDMFWMIRELGLAREYYDRLGDRRDEQLHPMFRRDADGKFISQDAAERILAEELAAASRGRSESASASDRQAYDRLFGEDGYIKVGEQLLADHGVHTDSVLPYVGEFHEFAPSKYTFLMSAGRISPKSADTYVVVDPSVHSDLTSGIVNALLLHAYARNGALLRDALGSTISDFVTDVRHIAQEALAKADAEKDSELSAQLRRFLRTCCDDVDRMVRTPEDNKVVVKKGVGLSPVGFTTLASAFGLFRAREDATNPMLRALSTIAPRVWATQSFLAFESLLNVTLGGNYLDTAIWNAKPGEKNYTDPTLSGVPQIMALASADAYALRKAVQTSLPAGMSYEQFLDAVLEQLTQQSKTGTLVLSEQDVEDLRAKARAAAKEETSVKAHFSFVGGLISTMKAAVDNKVVVYESVADFLSTVLEKVSGDPRATDEQRQAATKQLAYIRQRAQTDRVQKDYAEKVEELSATQERLQVAENKVTELRQRLVDITQDEIRRASYQPPVLASDQDTETSYTERRLQEMGVTPDTATEDQRRQVSEEYAALVAADQKAVDAWYQGLPSGTEVTDPKDAGFRIRKGANGQWYFITEDNTTVKMDAGQKAVRPRPAVARVTLPYSAGAGFSEADRITARDSLADAIAERDTLVADLLTKQETMTKTPPPEGLQALYLGGETSEAGLDAASVVEDEDEVDATIANDPRSTDVPEVFAREAAKREDGFTVEWSMPDNGQHLTRRQAKLAAGVVVRSISGVVSEVTFTRRLKDLFPHMTEVEQQDVLFGFRGLDAARVASGRDWHEITRPGQHFGFMEDEKSDEDKSSDNFNERALAEYNSDALKDFTALLRRVAPEANGSIMGFVKMMRGRVRGRATDAPAQDLLTGLLNPQMLPGVKNLSQADAQHKKTLKRFGNSDIAAVAESLLAEDPQAAFLVAYLSSLPVNARTRFAGLCAGSVAATPVHVVDGVTRIKSARVDGKISDMLITASFDRLIGMSSHRLAKLAETLRSEAKTLGVSAFSRTGGLEALKKNAAVVAELLATVTGRNSPLYRAMTSRLAHVAWARMDADQATSLLESVSRTGRGIDVVNTIARALELLAARGGRPTRLDVETTFVAAFTVGQPTKEANENGKVVVYDDPGLKRAPAHIDKSDPLLTFLNELQAAMPRTMMRAEIDQQREQAAGSVVVAPRGMVPLLSRWLYQKGEGSFTEICRATWPDVSDETLAECRQDGTWPDEARTPVCAKCISSSLTPTEVYRACQAAYSEKGVNWVPIYSGDHSSFTLLQVPAGVDLGMVEAGLAKAVPAEGFVNHSGGALGSDSAWGDIGAKYGVKSNHYYKDKTPKGNVQITEDQYKEGLQKVEAAVGPLGRKIPYSKPYVVGLLARNWQQVKNSDAVFAVSNGFDGHGNVLGGTGWAVQMAKAEGKPIHVFNQGDGTWYAWTGSEWAREGTPTLTKNFAGIGTRELNDAGRKAIADVYQATFGGELQSTEKPTYKSFAKAAYKAIGMHLMFTDTKRSAISSLEAQGTGLVGVDAQGNYGEHRVHIIHSWIYEDPRFTFKRDGRKADKNAAFLGSTFMAGYGAQAIADMSADPESNTKKVHVVGGAGRDLFFIKSLTISQNGLRGKFREGSAPRAVFDYLEKFRGKNDTLSTDTLTDDDSYKIGPGNSKGLRVVNNGGNTTVMAWVFDRLVKSLVEKGELQEGYTNDQLADAFKKYNRLTGDELDELVGPLTVKDNARGGTSDMKLSEIMPGAMVNVFDGWSGPALDLSYREDSAMAYTVANVAHKSNVPAEPGRAPRNYEVDALAMVRTLAMGGWLKTPELAAQFCELMANWGLLASSVYADPKFRKAMIQLDENLAELRRNGEFISASGRFSGQHAVEEMARQIMAKTRQAANLPLRGIDAPLVAAGASLDVDGKLIVHTTSLMEAAMLKGSELFTDEEQAFYGANRRLALCNVNVSNNGFRYGWFLAPDAEAKYPDAYKGGDALKRPGTNTARRHANAIAWAANEVRKATDRVDADPSEENKKAALDARKAFASMFVDHHGVSIDKYGDRYLSTYSVEDLFIPSQSDSDTGFDYSAVQCEGQDLVFNDATGGYHVFLGGTMFGLPRTPSYNGSMWLQTVRAGLPVTEEETNDERGWRAGADAMVSPDPYTNAILGCDHDGDKTKLYMLGVNDKGAVRTADVPAPEGPLASDDSQTVAKRTDFLRKAGAARLLELVRVDENGDEVVVSKDDSSPDAYWRISENARKRVSNTFVRFLFSLSRQLPTGETIDVGNDIQYRVRSTAGANDSGSRTKFLGGVASSPTKASPVNDSNALLKAGLPEILKPDGSAGTLGDPELAMEIATSAMDAGDARGVMVSLARSLHVAWALGAYDGTAREFRPDSAKGLFGPLDGLHWLRFMYHVDGISNATFDDIKEQVCGRLGWTRGMMDSVLTELLLRPGHVPVTDAEFERVLKGYAAEIKAHGPRYWMLRNSRVDDEATHRVVALSFVKSFSFGKRKEKKRFSKSSVMDALGLVEEMTGWGPVLVASARPKTLGDVIGRAIVANGRSKLLSQMARGSGRNSATGLVYAAVVKGIQASGLPGLLSGDGALGSMFDVETGLSEETAEQLDKALAKSFADLEVSRWVERRGLILGMRSFGQSINYLTADPGAPNAAMKAEAVATDFDPMFLANSGGTGRIPLTVATRMNEANQLMYRIGRDLMTVDARAVSASMNRTTYITTLIQSPSDQAREFAGRMLAKDTVAPWNLMRLRSNQQQVPLLAEFFAGSLDDVLGMIPFAKGKARLTGAQVYKQLSYLGENVVGKTHPSTHEDVFTLTTQLLPLIAGEEKKAQTMRAIRTWFTPKVLGARLAIEAFTSICYNLMVTSGEFAADPGNRAAAFTRMSPDSMGLEGLNPEARRRLRRGDAQPIDLNLKFGELALGLRRIMPEFRANDQQALDKVREMFDRVILGQAFTGPRTLAGEAAKFTKATSFSISRRSLAEYAKELAATKAVVKTLEDIKRLNIPVEDKADIETAWNALGSDTATVTPAVLFGALLPAYTLMTARMSGVPDERSTSLLSCLPERYYAALSAAEARRRATDDVVVPLLVGSDLAPQTFRRSPEGVVRAADSYALEEGEEPNNEARNRLRGGSGLREYRADNRSMNTVDIFDPAFETALDVLHDSEPAVPTTLPKATTVSHLHRGRYDANTAKLALAMGSLLGSWATVEYNGGTTFTIRGDLRGDAGTGKAVSIVVDTSSNPLLNSEEEIAQLADSSAYAVSLTEALNLGMTAEDFLLLPKEVRRAFVRKYGVGGVTSNKVAWSVGAKGIMTLVGKISVPGGGTKIYHEYFHQMMRMFESFNLLGAEDYKQLERKFGKDPSGRHKFNEEKAAEAFRKWVENNSDKDAEDVRSVFQRIFDFLKGLLEVLKHGFSYGDPSGEETLFQMMVHGIAQSSTARMDEAQMEATTAASVLLNKLQPALARGRMTREQVDEYVSSKEESVLRHQFSLPKVPKQARTTLEDAARETTPTLKVSALTELEEMPNAWQVDESVLKKSVAFENDLITALNQPSNTSAVYIDKLHKLLRVRYAMASVLGVTSIQTNEVEPVDELTVGGESDLDSPVDEAAEGIKRVTSSLVNNNIFYRTANSIVRSLEAGLQKTGAWTDDLAYVVRRYAANDALAVEDENLRKRSILHGLRRAMAQVNPEAAKSTTNAEIENSLAYRAALVMHQHLEASYLNHRPAGTSPAVNEAARHASQYNVSAWLLSTEPTAPSTMVTNARQRIQDLFNASPSGASKAELKLHLDQLDKLYDLVGDTTKMAQFRRDQGMATINEVIGSLRAGTKTTGVDDFGNLKEIIPIDPVDAEGNPTTVNPKAQMHLDSFIQSYQDPAVQESLKLALTTAYQVAAMAKYYGELDIHPSVAGDIAEAKRLARLNGIPEHMSAFEFLGEHLVGDSSMVDNPAYVDYACQSHFIAQNVDAWLRSMVRESFGAHEGLGRMLSDEHFEYQGLVNAITQKENWIAHMLGISLEPGGELLQVIRQKGEYRMENGEVVRRVGDEYIKFDNYGRKATSIKMTEEDLRRVDMWLKMCSAHANGQRVVVTGVDDLAFYQRLSRNPEDYSIDKIVEKRTRALNLNPVEWAIWRMTRQIPPDLLPVVHKEFVSEMLLALNQADAAMKEGTYIRGRHGTEETPAVHDAATYNSYVIGALVRRGIVTGYNPGGAVHVGGLPRYENAALVIPCDLINDNFESSDTYTKLRDAGREEAWLNRDFIVKEFMGVWDDTVRFVKRHAWLTHGDGQYFHAFGTALPFWRGSGIFMYNAIRSDRQGEVTPSDKLSFAEQFIDRLKESKQANQALSTIDPKLVIDDLDHLARFIGADHRAEMFLEDILAGQYELGEQKAVETGVVIPANATYKDIARAFYEKARQLVWGARAGSAEPASRQLELENIIARYEDSRLERGELFGGSIGFTDTDMFRMHGTLPANYQIGHKVHKCIDGLTNAMMSRATLVNLLLTPEGATGAPVYYADPNELAAEASGLPDDFWGNLAEWWQKVNPDIGEVYDTAKSGVQNAKAVYQKVRELHQIKGKGKAQIGQLGYTELGGDDSQLVSVDRWLVLDGNGEDFMNAVAGGEAMGYLKHFLNSSKIPGIGGAGVRSAIQHALSWSKSLSVGFSFFFPLATRWESPMGAVGAMSTIGSNWKLVGDWMKDHPDAANKIRGMFGGKAWITHDFIGMKDILRMMDSNDPFLADLYSWAAALGITVSTSVTNPMEPDKTLLLKDIRRMKDAMRRSMGAEAAGKFSRMMDALLVRQGDKAFNYVLNATKLAVVAQMCMKLRYQAKSQGKAFDPVRDLKKYSRYINAEIGGIDPMQFAWAHPAVRRLLGMMMFSWQWTVGAWQAGGGSVLTDMITGSKTMTRQERAYFAGRWVRMFLGVMVGVPAMFQAVSLMLAKALGGGDDDDDRWGTWENEDKTRWTAFDITPLLKAIARMDDTKLGGVLRRFKSSGRPLSALLGTAVGGLLGARDGNWFTTMLGGLFGAGTGLAVPGLIPEYTGQDTGNRATRHRRYYMHFGKQGWEFFRWFDDAIGQFASKLSMPLQRILEGVVGRNLGFMERALPWDEMGQFERWLSPTTDSALFNLAEAFLPFSVASMSRYGDAGILPIFGPVQMGESQTAVQKKLVAALGKWAANDRRGYSYGHPRRGKNAKPVNVVNDILDDARRNGLDPDMMLDKACGQVMRGYYGELFDLLPETPGGEFDRQKMAQVFRALHRLGSKKAGALSALKTRYKGIGAPWNSLPLEQRWQVRSILNTGFTRPFDY